MKYIKKYILSLLFIVSSTTIMAQELDKSHPAYMKVNAVLNNIKTAENFAAKQKWNFCVNPIKNAERSIEKIKTDFPDVNLNDAITRLEKVSALLNSQNAKKEEAESENQFYDKLAYALNKIYAEAPNKLNAYEVLDQGAFLKLEFENFNSTEVINKINSLPEANKNQTITKVLKILNNYNSYLNQATITTELSNLVASQSNDTQNPADKLTTLNRGIDILEVFNKIAPLNTKVSNELKRLNTLKQNVASSLNNVITSKIHQKYLNKIVWSNSIPTIKNESEITEVFKLGEPIFGTIFLGRSVREAQDSFSALFFELYVDGNLMPIFKKPYIYITKEMMEKSYVPISFIPTEDWITKNYQPYIEEDNRTIPNICKFIYDQIPVNSGMHEVKVVLNFRGNNGERLESSFKIDSSGNSEHYLDLFNSLYDKHIDNVRLPKAAMVNSSLSNSMLKIMNDKGSDQIFTKAIIVSDWEIERDKYTKAIIQRTLQGALVSKYPDGHCSYQLFLFGQSHTGGGNYSPTLHYVGAGKEKRIKCEHVK